MRRWSTAVDGDLSVVRLGRSSRTGASRRAVRVSPVGRSTFRGASPHQQPNAQGIEHRGRLLHCSRLRAVSLEGLVWSGLVRSGPLFCLYRNFVSGKAASVVYVFDVGRWGEGVMMRAFLLFISFVGARFQFAQLW